MRATDGSVSWMPAASDGAVGSSDPLFETCRARRLERCVSRDGRSRRGRGPPTRTTNRPFAMGDREWGETLLPESSSANLPVGGTSS